MIEITQKQMDALAENQEHNFHFNLFLWLKENQSIFVYEEQEDAEILQAVEAAIHFGTEHGFSKESDFASLSGRALRDGLALNDQTQHPMLWQAIENAEGDINAVLPKLRILERKNKS